MTTLLLRAMRGASLPLAVALGLGLAGCATTPGDRGAAALNEVPFPQSAPSPMATTAAPAAAAANATDGALPVAGGPVPTSLARAGADGSPAPVPVAEDPLRPGEAIDLNAAEIQERDLWRRVRSGFALPDLDDDYVRRAEQWYSTRPDYVARMTDRSSRYLYHIVDEVQKRGFPTELALLPFIESAFNPQALSVAKASGMWQFIPSTGKDYELKQNLFRDDRRNVLASTRAALDYLGRLHDMFGDWHLALAAYNWGEGNVQRAVARNQRAGLPTDYSSLRMPDETRAYVPKLQAVKNIVLRPEAYALALPPIENHPYFLSVAIERDIDVDLAARLAQLPLDEFKALNPQMNRPVILAAGTPQVLLPYDNANQFVRALPQHRGPLASWTAWVAPRTMRPAEAAAQAGTTEAELREINRIPPRMLVKAGSTLVVPRAAHVQDDVSPHVADNAVMQLAPDIPPPRRLMLKAPRQGSSVAAVARQYRVPAAQVARWNDVGTSHSFKAGQAIVVYVPANAKVASTVAASDEPAAGPTRRPAVSARAKSTARRGAELRPSATGRVSARTATTTRR